MKRNTLLISLLGIAICFLPSVVFAFDFSWQSPDNDKSLFYLGQIFGPVGTALPNGSGNALISQLFSVFNIAVLTLGSIVVSYTIILSTINTAQEGEVMGRKWSSLWIPLRSAVGMAFLIPTASGYSLLQMLMMEVVVHGVAAANQVWAKVVQAFAGSGTGLNGTVSIDNGQLATVANNLLKSAICADVLNSDLACNSDIAAKKRVINGYQSDSTNPSSAGAGVFNIGVQDPNDTSLNTVCGSYSAAAVPSSVQDAASWYASNQLAFGLTYSELQLPAAEVISNTPATSSNIIGGATNILYGNISSSPQKPPVSLDEQTQQALDNGWLFAGSYYFVLISNGNGKLTYGAPTTSVTPGSGTGFTSLTGGCQSAVTTALGKIDAYMKTSTTSTPTPVNAVLSLNSVPTPDGFSSAMDAIDGPINNFMNQFMATLTTNDPRGAIPSLADIGSEVLNIAQTIWFAVMIAALIIMLPACIMEMFQPICAAVAAVFAILIPLVTAVVLILWSVGAMIGIYLPLVPYLVFTFTALGWVLLVIETIVAAPIVALGLVSPAGEHLGKAAPAVLLVVNVFLRPSLMVIGFVIASKLADVMVAMLNYGFFATLSSSVHGAGLFGTIATLGLYGGTCVAIINECFSLIHVLPDKIVRWIGGQAEQSRTKELMAEAKKGAEKGVEAGAGVMKGVSGALQKQAEDWKKGGGGEEEEG
ncbi:MAG: DotA/TraY family protein [Proteobacteria bacterium]|nr:DotA/TraY family protein [Pseudomonadota bacterium]